MEITELRKITKKWQDDKTSYRDREFQDFVWEKLEELYTKSEIKNIIENFFSLECLCHELTIYYSEK